jgi:hypothetical protein
MATGLDSYLSVNDDGWITPNLCIYGIFVTRKIS